MFGVVFADPLFRLEQRRTCGASQNLPSNSSGHSIDVSSRCLCCFGKGGVQNSHFGAFEKRSLAAMRAEAQFDLYGSKSGPSPRGSSHFASMGRRIACFTPNRRPSLDRCRKSQNCRFELENRRGETVIDDWAPRGPSESRNVSSRIRPR